MLYRNCRSVRYRYESLYRYRRYRYPCLIELIEVSGTGIDVQPNLTKYPVPVIRPVYTGSMLRYVPHRTHPALYAVQTVPFRLSAGKKWEIKTESLLELQRRQTIFLGWFLCESDSELHILVRSQKQISFVCANRNRLIVVRNRMRRWCSGDSFVCSCDSSEV